MSSEIQRLGYVVVFVRDFKAAHEFYGNLLKLRVVRSNEETGVAEYEFPGGGPNLLIEDVAKADMDVGGLVGKFVGMSLFVHDIGAAYERLCGLGVRFESAPARQPWGGILAHFFDPDGNMWSLVEQGAS